MSLESYQAEEKKEKEPNEIREEVVSSLRFEIISVYKSLDEEEKKSIDNFCGRFFDKVFLEVLADKEDEIDSVFFALFMEFFDREVMEDKTEEMRKLLDLISLYLVFENYRKVNYFSDDVLPLSYLKSNIKKPEEVLDIMKDKELSKENKKEKLAERVIKITEDSEFLLMALRDISPRSSFEDFWEYIKNFVEPKNLEFLYFAIRRAFEIKKMTFSALGFLEKMGYSKKEILEFLFFKKIEEDFDFDIITANSGVLIIKTDGSEKAENYFRRQKVRGLYFKNLFLPAIVIFDDEDSVVLHELQHHRNFLLDLEAFKMNVVKRERTLRIYHSGVEYSEAEKQAGQEIIFTENLHRTKDEILAWFTEELFLVERFGDDYTKIILERLKDVLKEHYQYGLENEEKEKLSDWVDRLVDVLIEFPPKSQSDLDTLSILHSKDWKLWPTIYKKKYGSK